MDIRPNKILIGGGVSPCVCVFVCGHGVKMKERMKKHLIQIFCKKKTKTKTKTKTKKQTTKLSRTYAQKNKENIFSDKDQQSKIRPIYI